MRLMACQLPVVVVGDGRSPHPSKCSRARCFRGSQTAEFRPFSRRMDPTTGLMLLGLAVFASASFFFALAESALFALGQWRVRQLAGQPGGGIVAQLLEQPSELLATIVLGNTV